MDSRFSPKGVAGRSVDEAELNEALQDLVIRDLDTGKTRLLSEAPFQWIEQSDQPGRQLREQSAARASENRAAASVARSSTATMPPSGKLSELSTKELKQSGLRPVSRFRENEGNGTDTVRIRRRSSSQKRAQSDELVQMQSTALRSADLVRVTAYKKREREFAYLYRWQAVQAHSGPIRVLLFNINGRMLATAGADKVIRIWDVDARVEDKLAIPRSDANQQQHYQYQRQYLRNSAPKVVLRGHTGEIVDLSWSKNNFLVSGGMDKTVRLWHPTKKQCLRTLWHNDFVTTVCFHPSDEQICISGTCDGSLRLWHMKEEKLLSQAELDDFITACVITPDGSTVLVGTLHGRCKFYGLFDEIQGDWEFIHTTQLDVRSRRAKNGCGKKIAGLAFRPGGEELCVSSSDSRIRLYRVDDKAVLSKFIGHVNEESQLSASISPCGSFVLTGSENRTVCIWEMDNSSMLVPKRRGTSTQSEVTSQRKDVSSKGKNLSMESFDPHDNAYVTAAVFAPKRAGSPGARRRNPAIATSRRATGLVIVTASEAGEIRVFGSV